MNKALRALTLTLAFTISTSLYAQEIPRKLENLEIFNLNDKPAMLPMWGEKNLMIFYIDPDRAGQNQDFTDTLEGDKLAQHPDIFGFGVINLEDAPFIPTGLARAMAEKRTEHNGATVLIDKKRTLSTDWNLGDCNNKFVLLLVNKNQELIFLRSGVFSEQDKADFFEIIDEWKKE